MKNNIVGILILTFFLVTMPSASAYVFGMKSANNSIDNIKRIEQDYHMPLSMVSYIFNDWHWREKETMMNFADELWTNRIYHLTLTPSLYSAAQVRDGLYDIQYREFFRSIRQQNLKVIFRTMHEANGWRYPWSWDPEAYKDAWEHVYALSREEGLDTTNILFDFSVNHWDMPSISPEWPSQKAELLECTPLLRQEQWCLSFEDYYPGDEYVDVVWFTFYNRWKGNSDRKWLSPYDILYDKDWSTIERVKALGKPVIVDEMATSAIWYTQMYDWQRSRSLYPIQFDKKNEWLIELAEYLKKETHVLWAVYFNIDYTRGLEEQIIWEADRSAINVWNNQVYTWIYYVADQSSKQSFDDLVSLFDARVLWNGSQHFIYPNEDRILLLNLRNVLERRTTNHIQLKRLVSAIYTRLSEQQDLTDIQKKLLYLLKILKEYY